MALANIVTTNDIDIFFGVCCGDNSRDTQLLMRLREWTEMQARRYCRWGIAQATYTDEYHRREDIGTGDFSDVLDVQGDNVYLRDNPTPDGEILQLDNGYVTSITTLHEDQSAYFGQGGSDFAAATLLTEGTHFVPEYENGTFCKSGRIIRINRNWSSRPGTIKVTYVAGFTAAQLNDEYSFVKEAVLEEMQSKFSRVKQQRSGGGGPLRKVTYHGDVSYEYATASGGRGGGMLELSDASKSKLSTIRRLAL
jgi:hypothetical protein